MSLFVIPLLISFHILFLYDLENKSPPNELTQISPQKQIPIFRRKNSNTRTDSNISPKKLPLLEEKSPTPQHLSKLVNNNKILNLNIAAYSLNVLGSPNESTWSTKGGPTNKPV